MKTKTYFTLAALAVATLATRVSANVTLFNNNAAFNAQGTIAQDSFFNDFGEGFGFPPSSFTRGDVTYHSAYNLTWGNQTQYSTNPEVLIGNNYWTPIDASVNGTPQYNMLGFDIGISTNTTVSFGLDTNTGVVNFSNLVVPNTTQGNLGFLGFQADSGQYFTGFHIYADSGQGNLAGISNVELGHSGSVPDAAASSLLLGLGILALVGYRRSVTV